MSNSPDQYLKMYRSRSGLFQPEVAALLGLAEDGTMVCRHEANESVPNLRTALRYAILFDAPVETIFRGLYEAEQTELRRDATRLIGRQVRAGSKRRKQVVEFLEILIRRTAKDSWSAS